MSVLKNKRNLSPVEYVFHFIKLYDFTANRLKKIPKRKYEYLGKPIISQMNKIQTIIMQIHNQYFVYGIKLKSKPEQVLEVINEIKKLNKPLIALWNIEKYPTVKMQKWLDMINKEIRYLKNIGGLSTLEGEEYMFILKYKKIDEMQFLKNMKYLHRFIYRKIISIPTNYRETHGSLIIELINEAFYRVLKANNIYPTTKEEYIIRKQDIAIAMDCLQQLEPPVISLFLTLEFNEHTMRQWSRRINYEMKLLKGLQDSDEKNFGHLA